MFVSGACAGLLYLAEFLAVRVGQEGLEGLEAGVDALHAPPLVAIGDLAANAPLLVLSRLWAEGNVGQAEERESEVTFPQREGESRNVLSVSFVL